MEENLQKLKQDGLVIALAEIYVENCGLSLGNRTIAHNLAMEYIEANFEIDFDDRVVLFDKIMDEVDPSHRKYDIGLMDAKELNANKQHFLENNFEILEQYIDIINKIQ